MPSSPQPSSSSSLSSSCFQWWRKNPIILLLLIYILSSFWCIILLFSTSSNIIISTTSSSSSRNVGVVVTAFSLQQPQRKQLHHHRSPFTPTTKQQKEKDIILKYFEKNSNPIRLCQSSTSLSTSLLSSSDDHDDDHDHDEEERITNDSSSGSVELIQQRLVQYGLKWKQEPLPSYYDDDSSNNNDNNLLNNMTRVPGCVATVYIGTKLIFEEGKKQQQQEPTICIVGNSDAILSRGILAMLSEYLLSLKNLQLILGLDPNSISDVLQIRKALTKGRNDGMANMLSIIQQQIQQQLNQKETSSTSSSSSAVVSTKGVADSTLIKDEIAVTATPTTTDDSSNKKTTTTTTTVALLLSGGVDSSVALRLLQQQGHTVTAYYLKIWLEDEMSHLNECPWEDDMAMCRLVCDQADVELKVISLQDEYHAKVMQHTLNEASMGRTPNPDILCNSRIKFGCFLDYLKTREGKNHQQQGYDYIASGHYAQLDRSSSTGDNDAVVKLRRAPDPIKDQSYFLCALNQKQLSKLLFPIGHLQKSEVRQLANDFELPNRNRPDSQGLCFLGKVKFRDFLQLRLGCHPGDIVDAVTGDIIGRHDGVWYHTVGQRKGIGNSLDPLATAKGPWYVVAKNPSENIVYASNLYDEEVFMKARSEFHVENIHWISGNPPVDMIPGQPYRLEMKIRHGPRLVKGSVTLIRPDNVDDTTGIAIDDDDGGGAIIQLDTKDGGLAPGQYVVFYKENDNECFGGGIISERHWARFLLDTESRGGNIREEKSTEQESSTAAAAASTSSS